MAQKVTIELLIIICDIFKISYEAQILRIYRYAFILPIYLMIDWPRPY